MRCSHPPPVQYDKDHSGHLDFDEFVDLVIDHSSKVLHEGHHHEHRPSFSVHTEPGAEGEDAHTAEEEEEEEEMPEDLRDLPWEKQQFRLKLRSCYMMMAGTALILIFAVRASYWYEMDGRSIHCLC